MRALVRIGVRWEPALCFYSLVPEEMYADFTLRASYAPGTALQRELILETRYTAWARTLLNMTTVLGDVAVGSTFQLYKRLRYLCISTAPSHRGCTLSLRWARSRRRLNVSRLSRRVASATTSRRQLLVRAAVAVVTRLVPSRAGTIASRSLRLSAAVRSSRWPAVSTPPRKSPHQAMSNAQDESLEGATINPLVLLGPCLRSRIMPLVYLIVSKSLGISMYETSGLLLPARL